LQGTKFGKENGIMRKTTVTSLLLALVAASAAPAHAGWEEGVQALKAGNLDQALREFQGVVSQKPDWPGGHFMVGQVYLRQGKAPDAVNALRKANELEAGNPTYQYTLGQAYVKAGRYADGVQILQKINPASLPKDQQGAYHQLLAAALDRSGDDSSALGALQKAAQANPSDGDLWYQYGVAAFNAGDTAAGANALAQAIRLDGNDPAKKVAYAKALIRLGREKQGSAKQDAYNKAVEAARSVASGPGASYDNLLLLGEAQLGAKDYAGAAATFERAAAKKDDWLPYFYLSQAQAAVDRLEQSEAAARTALTKVGSDSDRRRVWGQIGFINEKLRKFDEAILAYRNAGDGAGAQRVEENKRIAAENKEIEEHNKEIEALEAEKRKLEEQLKGLPGGGG
jgi:cytochrome c-type biogenesis protein CcmH/NrfG